MLRKLFLTGLVVALASAASAATAAADATVKLNMPQGTAFSILGYDCGGINEHAFASGFDAVSGGPDGDVYMWTTCNAGGRGGRTFTVTAWASVNWNFDTSVAAYAVLTGAPTVNPAFSAVDGHGDTLYNQTNQAYVTVLPVAAPTGVGEAPSGGQFLITWTPDPTASPDLIMSSTIAATPVGSAAPVVTATVDGASASGLLGPLAPDTTYSVTVTSNDAAGAGPPSQAITIQTASSNLPPGPPAGVAGAWTAPGTTPDQLVITWSPGVPGDSPADEYGVRVFTVGAGTRTGTVAGATLTDTFNLDDGVNSYFQVRAHDAAGWGRWSKLVKILAVNG